MFLPAIDVGTAKLFSPSSGLYPFHIVVKARSVDVIARILGGKSNT